MIIIGGGASGLIAAILIAREGIAVTLLEQNSKIGKKILVSGNGKCNITNRHIAVHRFHSQNPPFIESVLQGYDFARIEAFFHSIGVELIEEKEGKVFPMSRQAASVVEMLEYEAQRAGVEIRYDCTVKSITEVKQGFMLHTTQGDEACDLLLLASGSPAAPQLGGTFGGLEMAASLGHALIPAYPSLVQLCSDEVWVKAASGVKVEAVVKLYANSDYVTEKRGDILFTNYGISGLAILDISYEVSQQLAAFAYCELSLDIMPELNKEQLTNLLTHRVNTDSSKPLMLWLLGILNKKLIPVVIEQSKCRAKTEQNLNRKEVGKLVYAIKNRKLSISDTRGFEGAEVATGGVDTTEVNPQTMESKRVKKLYLAGEILDVDGDR
ncbi:MAG TPA: NAD(P)/FAD-dependent oxidoreductase, partial [Epsilonproteobacteria bacterium]|nr:NAD(P)/FAD-dependent oxidoreductase [Campylobacterota bacterium]